MSLELPSPRVALLATAGAVGVGALAYWLLRRRQTPGQRSNGPRAGEVLGQVKSIVLYPVKSIRGIEVSSAYCLKRGFKYDRRFVIVDTASENPPEGTPGKFLNLISTPKLAKIQPRIIEVGDRFTLVLQTEGCDPVEVPEPDTEGCERVSLHVYRTEGEALDCGDTVARWLSAILGLPGIRLYYMSEDVRCRMIAEDPKWGDRGRPGQETSFANFAPYMLCTEQSRVDISSRVGQELEMARFRPNIIVSSALPTPYQEDNWTDIQISNVSFYMMKKCGRCPMTTIHPQTGEKTGPEPLKTLREFRLETSDARYANSPIFGIQIGAEQEGAIRVGDDVVMQ
ncbi:mitochondrial amidoxime reducing component 2-like [Sycon ciliatum]|uniref:mitochondrial amidoxime reducing component 2-like n=1 Tax=Sycon ciliatum TaxID=27933 RepID=UPI0020A92C4D|eukprot:scpid69753/ scgid31081/ MOSC domain-containing protein 1, mitochondrial; Mitochondrial amidoxime reducing component 1; Moco sulfurase C-terminal domain-containing protein 1; Molybdenum cofactor sulfurase C-terminal domain-containing protein 1